MCKRNAMEWVWVRFTRCSVAVFQCGTAANPPVMNILYLAVNWEVATAQKEDGHQEE